MAVETGVEVTIPGIFAGEGLSEAYLTSTIRGAMNEILEDTLNKVKASTVIFRGNTRRGWVRTNAEKLGTSFIASISNEEITASILEYGAPDRFRGSPGFSVPPPIQSKTAGSGRTIMDWVQEVDPVFVGGIVQQMQKRKGQGRLFYGNQGQYSQQQQAARKAAYAVAGAIARRGLPSPANQGSLLLVSRIANQAQQDIQERVRQAVQDTANALRSSRVTR